MKCKSRPFKNRVPRLLGLWMLLLAALIIESLLGFTPREMAAEWFIFMLGSAYSVISDLRAGIWDRHFKANTKTNAAVSVVGGAAVFVWGAYQICSTWHGHCGAAGGHHGGLYLGAVLCIAAAQHEGLQNATLSWKTQRRTTMKTNKKN